MDIPEDLRDIMITYKKNVYSGVYGDTITKEIVTKRGFYSKLFNNFSIPPRWSYFNGVLLPDGWGGDHISINEVIKWEYC